MCPRAHACVLRSLWRAGLPAPTGSRTSRTWGLACSSENQWPGERVTPLCAVDFPGHLSPHNGCNDLGIRLLLGINTWLGLMALTASWAIFPASHSFQQFPGLWSLWLPGPSGKRREPPSLQTEASSLLGTNTKGWGLWASYWLGHHIMSSFSLRK